MGEEKAVLPSYRAVLVVAYVGGGYQVSALLPRGVPLCSYLVGVRT